MPATSVSIEHYAPAFRIDIDGVEMDPLAAHAILDMEVEQELNKTNQFSFTVQDELREGRFRWLGREPFRYGRRLSVSLGYAGRLFGLARGKIQSISADFPETGEPTFSVEGADDSYQTLMVPSGVATFREKSHADIARDIARAAGMDADVDDTGSPLDVRSKRGGESLFAFLRDLAAEVGHEVQLSGRNLVFRRPRTREAADVTLRWGESLLSFAPALSTAQALTEVVVRGWDPKAKKSIEARVQAGEEARQEPGKRLSSEIARELFGDVVREITDQPVKSQADAKRIAKAELEKNGERFISGVATAVGRPELRPGTCVEIEGLGEWFSGKYYVEKVTHRLDENGYRSSFEARRNTL